MIDIIVIWMKLAPLYIPISFILATFLFLRSLYPKNILLMKLVAQTKLMMDLFLIAIGALSCFVSVNDLGQTLQQLQEKCL